MSDTSTDDAILQQVPNIAGLLGLKQFTPKKLMWQDSLYMGRGGRIPIPVDYVFVGPRAMILAQRMQSVLTPEEWRPLIGSTLLMRAWTRPRLVRMITIGIIAALAYYIPISILFFYTNILGPAGIFLESPLGFIVALVAFALYGRSTSPQAHQEALRADVEVARVVGRDVFLSTLQKIDSMGFNEVAKLDRKPSRFKKPSIQERIQNLQSSGILPPSQ